MQSERDDIMVQLAQLRLDRSGWEPDYRDISDFIDPWGLRLSTHSRNRGERKGQKIINSTASMAQRTLAAGMTAGVTNPFRPWLRLTTADPYLAEVGPVRAWLNTVTQRMLTLFLSSNLYQALPQVYKNEGTYGTAAMIMDEDRGDLFRYYVQPTGAYYLSVDDRLNVGVFAREYRWTVRQVVQRFIADSWDSKKLHWERGSAALKNAWDLNRHEQTVEILHIIRPNPAYDKRYMNSERKRFQSCYIETSSSEKDRFLRKSGYDQFPVLAPRWDVVGEDVYGVGPGHVARGDAKAIQLLERRKSQAIEKMVNPPLTGPTSARNEKVSLLAGDITFIDVPTGREGLRPIHEVSARIDAIGGEIQEHTQRINQAFYVDLFMMIAMSDARERVTRREIEEKHEEKMLMLGPTVERQTQDMLNQMIDRAFYLMSDNGMIPPAPKEIEGTNLRVEYLGVLAQTQKLVGTISLERFTGFVTNLSAVFPGVLHKVDADQVVDEYASATGISPDVVRSDDEVAEIRAAEAKAQQAAMAAQQNAMAAQNVQTLSKADMSGDNALTRLAEMAGAE